MYWCVSAVLYFHVRCDYGYCHLPHPPPALLKAGLRCACWHLEFGGALYLAIPKPLLLVMGAIAIPLLEAGHTTRARAARVIQCQ
jgi:hypothetical protein